MHGLIFISDNNDVYIAWDKNMKKNEITRTNESNENLQKFNKIIQLSMVDVLKEFEQKTKITFKKEIFKGLCEFQELQKYDNDINIDL